MITNDPNEISIARPLMTMGKTNRIFSFLELKNSKLESDRKEVVETFIYLLLCVALERNELKTNTKVPINNITKITKTEGLTRLISLLPEKEQAKIYYMVTGFEIFSKNPPKKPQINTLKRQIQKAPNGRDQERG